MYPSKELGNLRLRKIRLQARIALHREEIADSTEVVLRPLVWVDGARARWQKISPMAKLAVVPLSLLLRRTLFRRHRIIGSLLRFAPLVWGFMKSR